MRGKPAEDLTPVLVAGAILLGPLVAWGGYAFLRDPELEPYSGAQLWLRATICGLVYALAWLVFWFIVGRVEPDYATKGLAIFQMLIPSVFAVIIGTLAAYVTLDLEPFNAFFHCALYFVLTVLLRWILELPPLPGLWPSP